MTNNRLRKFVETYSIFYEEIDSEKKKYGIEKYGVRIIHPTSKTQEDEVIAYLSKGEQSINTIAWKLGVDVTPDGLKTQYHEYQRDALEKFCELTNKVDYNFEDEDGIRDAYNKVSNMVSELDLVGYGSVYIISSLFFLSKGKVPIYDYYANVAVKALLNDVNPQRVFVAQAPVRDEHSRNDKTINSAVNMLMEYRKQLELLAKGTEYFNTNGMYISRELDRALWVYGHATKKWPELCEGKWK